MAHGGDIYRNQVELDFSVNINPLGMPDGVKEALTEAVAHCKEYPDITCEKLRDAIGSMWGFGRERILCGNGASELLLAALCAIRPEKTGICAPSFSGYEYAAKAAGSRRVFIPLREEEGFCLTERAWKNFREDIGALVFANPNNPSGGLPEPGEMEAVIKDCEKKGIIVIVDESFMEFTGREETHSLKLLTDRYKNLIVVRAFTKLYAIPGVRLGYLFSGSREWLERIGSRLPEWNVSVFAQAAGTAACKEEAYRRKTEEFIRAEREYLAEGLRQEGLRVLPSQANFLLFETDLPVYERLLERKILIRNCGGFRGLGKGFYRVAVKTREENRRLLQAVAQIREDTAWHKPQAWEGKRSINGNRG